MEIVELFAAAERGDIDQIRAMLTTDPGLARAVAAGGPHSGWTILHDAAKRGSADLVRLLLAHGADPNAREAGDNTYPLHWAAARGDLAIMAALLDAGGDVHGFGADHAGDVIGWGTFFTEPGKDVRAVADFLVSRGARHNIFSAMSVGDLDLIRSVIEENPEALESRLSRFEHGLTPLQFAVVKKRDDILSLLIELGADLEAVDIHGQTALTGALALGNEEAARRLKAAGATPPGTMASADFTNAVATMSGAITKIVPMLNVPDVAAALEWYKAVGFTELGRYGEQGVVNWGMVRFGGAEIMLNMHGKKGEQPVSLWLYTDRVDELYALFKARQLDAAQAGLAGNAGERFPIAFVEEIYDPPYGGREFGIRDLNGYELFFLQPARE
jgi:ankyrin repeat protein